MSHNVNCINGVFTVRIDGRSNAQEVYQDMRSALDKQTTSVSVIIDLTHTTSFDQNLKAMFYRVLQHGHVNRAVGICGINPVIASEINELLIALQRVRKVCVGPTDVDVRTTMGLSTPIPEQRKLSGMLTYLK